MLSVMLNWMWIRLTIKSLSCFQLVAIRERTFVLKWRKGNHEVWIFVPSRLDLAEDMDIWKDNGQEVRRSGGQKVRRKDLPKWANCAFTPRDHILQKVGSSATVVPGEVFRVKPCVFLLQGLGQKHPPLKDLRGSFRDFLVRSDCLLWTKTENKQHKHKSKRPLTQGVNS